MPNYHPPVPQKLETVEQLRDKIGQAKFDELVDMFNSPLNYSMSQIVIAFDFSKPTAYKYKRILKKGKLIK